MSNYKVEKAEIRTRKSGDEFLQLKINNNLVAFLEKEDRDVNVREGDIVSCKIEQKGKFFNGTALKVLDKDSADIKIENKIIIDEKTDKKWDRKNDRKYGRKLEDSDSKLHAGARIYFFDVKTTSRGDKYLVVNEQSGDKRNRIFIFEDHAEEFSEKLAKNLKKLKEK